MEEVKIVTPGTGTAPVGTPATTTAADTKVNTVVKAEVEVAPKKKHIITFIGNGVHKDSLGKAWFKGEHENPEILSSREYSDEDYATREDLHFMVQYGAMKCNTISLTEVKG